MSDSIKVYFIQEKKAICDYYSREKNSLCALLLCYLWCNDFDILWSGSVDIDLCLDELEKYFLCQAQGYPVNQTSHCHSTEYQRYIYSKFAAITFSQMGLLPTVQLIFVIDCKNTMDKITSFLIITFKRVTFTHSTIFFQ